MSSAVPTTSLPDSADTVLPLAVQRKPRVLFLDVLRGIAVTVVLFQHLSEDVSQNVLFWGHRWINFGRLGVALFFSSAVLSSLQPRTSQFAARVLGQPHLSALSDLLVQPARGARLSLWRNYTMETEYHNHFAKTMLVNIFLIQQFVHVQHAIGLYWTLTLEMVFYVIFSVLFALGINKKSLLWCWCSIRTARGPGICRSPHAPQDANSMVWLARLRHVWHSNLSILRRAGQPEAGRIAHARPDRGEARSVSDTDSAHRARRPMCPKSGATWRCAPRTLARCSSSRRFINCGRMNSPSRCGGSGRSAIRFICCTTRYGFCGCRCGIK